MAPTTSTVLSALATFIALTNAMPTPARPVGGPTPDWQVAFHSGNTCTSTPFQIASGNGPTTGCATITQDDGTTPASAAAISVSNPGFTVQWYADAGCQKEQSVGINQSAGNAWDGDSYDHCDVPTEAAKYYKVVAK
ncbi:MAG: hypothetical protein M1828_006524 [Chrysothrix sp. TS-e1954]|nr:MAG: hypothetical protein M1828_006524 [Chrysothrix sp. TS-e1954]